jgi:Flp pilus assembly protein TadD
MIVKNSSDFANTRETARICSWRLRVDANDVDAWHTLGTALAALGDRAGAYLALRTALLLDDRRPHTHFAMGKLLFDTVRFEEALRCFESAVARESHGQ